MKLPNKVIPFQDSTIAKFPTFLSVLAKGDISVSELYSKVKSEVTDVGEYIEILDCLFALRKIDYIKEKEVLHYVG